mmetsp:Transcript_44511/g.45002  ORF Transcript_44511/g.45002 Transcript_44511/m.45002 type:complete len:92 (+) Transcript_44511:153-428(+)
MDTVPSDRHDWPVGLSNYVLEYDTAKYSMDDYEVLQQLRLRQQKSELEELKPAFMEQATFLIASISILVIGRILRLEQVGMKQLFEPLVRT